MASFYFEVLQRIRRRLRASGKVAAAV